MKAFIPGIHCIGLILAAQALCAQEVPMMSGAEKEHQWLKKFVGEWDVVSQSPGGEGQPPVSIESVMKSSMLGELWLVNESEMDIGGTKVKSIQLIGYDPQKKKYVGTWVDSMFNHLWHYQGTVDQAGKKLTLDAVGPSMTDAGKMANYRDAYEFQDDNTMTATSTMQGEDGKWVVIMEGTAKQRQKK